VKRNASWVAWLPLFVAAAEARAQTSSIPPDAAALLSKAAAAYVDDSAHAATFTQIYTPSGFATARRESGEVWIQAPQRLRFEYAAPERKIFTYDSGEGRFFSPEDKQLTIRKLSAEEIARLPIVFLARPEELAKRYEIQLDASKAVLFKPRAPDPDLAWLKLSITPSGTVDALSYEDASGSRTEFRFDAWRKEKPRPPADYKITGPKGTRIVEN
jgi:outer membrane lipoprotein-sorting protein